MSKRGYWEDSAQESLSLEDLESKALTAADKLIALDDVSGEEAEELRDYFGSECISLLAQNYSISAPARVTQE